MYGLGATRTCTVIHTDRGSKDTLRNIRARFWRHQVRNPITDRKTVRMKLAVVCAIAAVLVVSVTRTPPADLRLHHAHRAREIGEGVVAEGAAERTTGQTGDGRAR